MDAKANATVTQHANAAMPPIATGLHARKHIGGERRYDENVGLIRVGCDHVALAEQRVEEAVLATEHVDHRYGILRRRRGCGA